MEEFAVYEIGDYIVKSVNGVCKVEDILYLSMSEEEEDKLYYLLVPVDDKKEKIYLPVDTANLTIRRVMTEEEVWELIHKVPEIEEESITNEKLCEHKYKEAVRSCNPEVLIGIIKMIYMRRRKRIERGKKSTVVDERYFRLAENSLYSELGFVLQKDKEEISQLIAESVEKQKARE